MSKCQCVSGVDGGMIEGSGQIGGDWRACHGEDGDWASRPNRSRLNELFHEWRAADKMLFVPCMQPNTPRTPTTATSSIGGHGGRGRGAAGRLGGDQGGEEAGPSGEGTAHKMSRDTSWILGASTISRRHPAKRDSQ
jgi:hypothetical protein